jgi:biotin carboxylase
MRIADAAYAVDIMDSEAVINLARRESVVGVTSICTDFAVRTVAAVGRVLALPAISPEGAKRATDKRAMRRALHSAGVPSPQFAEVADLNAAVLEAHRIGYPVALKIPCSAGSRGIYRVANEAEMGFYFQDARLHEAHQTLLIEEWLAGPEVSVEGVCVGTRSYVVQITDKLLFPGPYPVEAGHTQPSAQQHDVVAAIEDATKRAVEALCLENCGFHAELIIASRGACVVEVAARLGGDHISTDLTHLSTGIDLVGAVLDIALGLDPDLTPKRQQGSAIRYFAPPVAGELLSVSGLDELPRARRFPLLSRVHGTRSASMRRAAPGSPRQVQPGSARPLDFLWARCGRGCCTSRGGGCVNSI